MLFEWIIVYFQFLTKKRRIFCYIVTKTTPTPGSKVSVRSDTLYSLPGSKAIQPSRVVQRVMSYIWGRDINLGSLILLMIAALLFCFVFVVYNHQLQCLKEKEHWIAYIDRGQLTAGNSCIIEWTRCMVVKQLMRCPAHQPYHHLTLAHRHLVKL